MALTTELRPSAGRQSPGWEVLVVRIPGLGGVEAGVVVAGDQLVLHVEQRARTALVHPFPERRFQFAPRTDRRLMGEEPVVGALDPQIPDEAIKGSNLPAVGATRTQLLVDIDDEGVPRAAKEGCVRWLRS